jgi:hypothetical protein
MAEGACLCGAIRYAIDEPFSWMGHCHCSMCRKHHGSLFATFVGAPVGRFRWLTREAEIASYASSAQGRREFCTVCGSVAPVVLPQFDLAIAPAGNLSGDLGQKPDHHIFVGSKAPWYAITDQLRQYEAYPPGFPAPAIERPAVAAKPGFVLGSCLCGEVAFEIEGAPLRAYNCHCSRCRRGRSAAHATNYFYRIESFRWTRGEGNVAVYRVPEAKRFAVAFCRRCGGAVPRVSMELKGVIVPAGSFDSDPGMQPLAHIFVSSKAGWFDITDQLPQNPELPPS